MDLRIACTLLAIFSGLIEAAPERSIDSKVRKIEERGEPCHTVDHVVEVLKRQYDPYEFCDNYEPKNDVATVFVTETSTVTETEYTTVTTRLPTCPEKRRLTRDTEVFAEIDRRDPEALPRLPSDLEEFGANKVQKACHCLEKREGETITKTVQVTATTTTIETKTVCETLACLPKDEPCDINHPEVCCSQTCGVADIGPGYYCY